MIVRHIIYIYQEAKTRPYKCLNTTITRLKINLEKKIKNGKK